jgi:uncharacterized protein YndB with AHSA1/START domain
MGTDRIEKEVVLHAPRSRVWRALTNVQEFGTWFGVKFEGTFTPNARLQGQITVPGYEHVTMDITVVRLDPERCFSWRWHPNAVDPSVDYSAEPTTLVEFHLEEIAGGTRLTVVESGFDGIPLARRAKALEANEGGWAAQLEKIGRHVSA